MWTSVIVFGAFFIFTPYGTTSASAQCIEDFRKVGLDTDNDVDLRSYVCHAGIESNSPVVRVEFHRLAEVAASSIIATYLHPSNGFVPLPEIERSLGSTTLIKNEIFKTYADLLQRFGTNWQYIYFSYSVQPAGGKDRSKRRSSDKMVSSRTLSSFRDRMDYLAIDEIISLRNKVIPHNLRYFYSVNDCRDSDNPTNPDNQPCMIMWRGMRLDDIANYPQRIAKYNWMVGKWHNDTLPAELPSTLKLVRYVAGDDLPEDFVILRGYQNEQDWFGCTWRQWAFVLRDIVLDVMLVENISNERLSVGNIVGLRSLESKLRLSSNYRYFSGDIDKSLAPGEKLFVPTRISFLHSDSAFLSVARTFKDPAFSNDMFRHIGANGFRGNTSGHGAPSIRNYLFGVDIAISGIMLNGKPVQFTRRSANFFDFTAALQMQSCPYLLSWSAQAQEWVEHGQLLHDGSGKQNEYTETITLPGWRTLYRIEEREAETALIDKAELNVALKDGSKIVLTPADARLIAHDSKYVQLFWGEAVDIKFDLPQGIAEEDVVESRLSVTGYYDRYSDLPLRTNQRRLPKFFTARFGSGSICPKP